MVEAEFLSSNLRGELEVFPRVLKGLQGDAERIQGGSSFQADIGFEQFEHHFPALSKAAFDQRVKEFFVREPEQRRIPADENDASRIDFGRRIKTRGRYFESGMDRVSELQEEGQDSVIVIIGFGSDAAGDFPLQSSNDAGRSFFGLGEFDEDGRCHRVGKVGNDFPGGEVRASVAEKVQGIFVPEVEMAGTGPAFLEVNDEAMVFFEGENVSRFGEEQFSERSKAGANFEDLIVGMQVCSSDDAVELVLIMEKILAERFGELEFFGGEGLFNFVEIH